MDFSAFFDYPEGNTQENTEDFVFLATQSPDDWEKIFSLTGTRRFQTGEVVIKIGELDRAFHIVTKGTLEVVMPTESPYVLHQIAVIKEGSIFGEQSFFDGKPRSANVRGVTEGEMLTMSFSSFEVLAAREPELARIILLDLARILSIRLRQTTTVMMQYIGLTFD